MKTYFDSEPKKFEDVGHQYCLYRYDIKKEVREASMEGEEPQEVWSAEEVKVYYPITENSITEAVIMDKWDNNYQQKLINEYNSVVLGIYGEAKTYASEQKVEAYKQYLIERAKLKEMVTDDCVKQRIG